MITPFSVHAHAATKSMPYFGRRPQVGGEPAQSDVWIGNQPPAQLLVNEFVCRYLVHLNRTKSTLSCCWPAPNLGVILCQKPNWSRAKPGAKAPCGVGWGKMTKVPRILYQLPPWCFGGLVVWWYSGVSNLRTNNPFISESKSGSTNFGAKEGNPKQKTAMALCMATANMHRVSLSFSGLENDCRLFPFQAKKKGEKWGYPRKNDTQRPPEANQSERSVPLFSATRPGPNHT